jgi:hypothetical protein
LTGLYELVGSKSDGAIVRSLDDKTTKFVSSRVHNFSHLESIEVYTVRDNINLVELFKNMEASGERLPSDKDGDAVKKYFLQVYPDMDFERVYMSDMKKMIKWFAILQKENVEFKLSEVEEDETEEAVAEPTPAVAEAPAEKPKKKAAPKKKKEADSE